MLLFSFHRYRFTPHLISLRRLFHVIPLKYLWVYMSLTRNGPSPHFGYQIIRVFPGHRLLPHIELWYCIYIFFCFPYRTLANYLPAATNSPPAAYHPLSIDDLLRVCCLRHYLFIDCFISTERQRHSQISFCYLLFLILAFRATLLHFEQAFGVIVMISWLFWLPTIDFGTYPLSMLAAKSLIFWCYAIISWCGQGFSSPATHFETRRKCDWLSQRLCYHFVSFSSPVTLSYQHASSPLSRECTSAIAACRPTEHYCHGPAAAFELQLRDWFREDLTLFSPVALLFDAIQDYNAHAILPQRVDTFSISGHGRPLHTLAAVARNFIASNGRSIAN